MSELIGSKGNISDNVANQKAPKIEFPCRYPIKVLGHNDENFKSVVVEIMTTHAGVISDSDVTLKPSAKGTFVSVTVIITATGEVQLTAIFEELKATGRVKMVI